ncbi:hypothetical protein [Peptoniphilus duerdenii]|uniref:hypothetical protein n=1 Tax=Peptoniphilus duerdenii TaxID=507750 RepID=UPI00288A6EB6|nr:hypothetical protein [Peptoniphilus duerdenii]
METNDNKTNLVLSVDLSLGKDFKESVKNCMDFLQIMQKEYSCNCTLKVNVEQDSGSYSQRIGIDECEKIGERILKG